MSSSVRAELIRSSRSRAADDDTMENSRVTAMSSSVRAEMMRPSRAAKSRARVGVELLIMQRKHYELLLCVAVSVLK